MSRVNLRFLKRIHAFCILFLLAGLTAVGAVAAEVALPDVFSSVRNELKGVSGSYFLPDKSVSWQIIQGLGIPSPTKKLADGNLLVSGCRRHSCDEKAAVIVTPAGKLLMAGLIHFHCHRNAAKKNAKPTGATSCDSDPRLTVFVKQKNNQPEFTRELQDWAERESSVRTLETQIIP